MQNRAGHTCCLEDWPVLQACHHATADQAEQAGFVSSKVNAAPFECVQPFWFVLDLCRVMLSHCDSRVLTFCKHDLLTNRALRVSAVIRKKQKDKTR